MIPVLYGPTEKRFTSRGLGPLPDASMTHIEEVRLGEYELEMEYPVTGLHFDELQYGNVIKARNAYLGEQPFDIYYISKPMSGIVTVRARHISYRLNKKVLTPCSSSSAAGAMSAIETHILDGSDFTFWTDKSTQANWAVTEPKNVRAALGGTEGSILDVFGGEYEWDGFTVKLHGNRGADNGVSIRFGKNLLDLVAELDASDVVTACVPYYTASDGTCVYGSKVKSSAWSSVNDLVTVMDMKEYFTAPEGAAENWTPTTAAMEETALSLMEQRLVYQATQHLKVDFALLSQSKEYAHLAALERVNLCDYVTVDHPGMGIDVKVKVIKTVWDVLADRYDSIELGEPTARLSETLFKDLNDALNGIQSALDDKVSRTHMDIAIENATNLLTGGTGGHVVIGRNADGEPNEIFIMNTADQSTATSVIRINMNGIGFSSTGINGPFRSAWTIDGHFVADFIDTGTLTGSIIKAGILRDEAGINYWNMETGEFQLTPGAKVKTGTNTSSALSSYVDGIASDAVDAYDSDLDQQAVFNKLTNNSQNEGIYLSGNHLYVNASMVNAGTLSGDRVRTGLITDETGRNYWNLTTGELVMASYAKTTEVTAAISAMQSTLETQIDGKIDTFYQSTDPSTNWTTEQKTAHTGDLWYKTTDNTTWRWSGSAWQEQDVPTAVFDEIDGKSTIFYGSTSGTYNGVQAGDYLVDPDSGSTFKWSGSAWVKQTDYQSAIDALDADLDQNEIFDRLTNGGTNEGIYLQNGHLYVNASMMATGILRSRDSNSKFSLNMDTGAISMKDATLTGGSLTTQNGLYENVVEDGYIYYYHDDDYIGKVGTSLFTVQRNNQTVSAKGMMMDIGYDAELGGIAIQETSGGQANLAFYYDRDDDMFHFDKDVQINGEDVATQTWVTGQNYLQSADDADIVIEGTGAGSGSSITIDNTTGDYGIILDSDITIDLSATSCISLESGNNSLGVSSVGALYNGQEIATRTWVNSSLSTYATKTYADKQRLALHDGDFNFFDSGKIWIPFEVDSSGRILSFTSFNFYIPGWRESGYRPEIWVDYDGQTKLTLAQLQQYSGGKTIIPQEWNEAT